MKLVFLIVPILGTILSLLGMWNDDLFPFSMLGEFLFPVLHCIVTRMALKKERHEGESAKTATAISFWIYLGTKVFLAFFLEPALGGRFNYDLFLLRCFWICFCFAVFQLFRRDFLARLGKERRSSFLIFGISLAVHALTAFITPKFGDLPGLLWFPASCILLSVVSFYLGMKLRDAGRIWILIWLLGVVASCFVSVCLWFWNLTEPSDFFDPLSLKIWGGFSVGIWMWYPIGRLLGRRFDKKREVL